jgi:Ser-tRNA(Ala) deacylase AlaX
MFMEGEGKGEEEVEKEVKRLQEIMRECKRIIDYLKREEERRKKERGEGM